MFMSAVSVIFVCFVVFCFALFFTGAETTYNLQNKFVKSDKNALLSWQSQQCCFIDLFNILTGFSIFVKYAAEKTLTYSFIP